MHCHVVAALLRDTQPASSCPAWLLQVLVNGRPRSRGFRSITAYVLQVCPPLLLGLFALLAA